MEHQTIRKPRSFLSTLALGLSAVVITVTLSAVVIVLYAMNITDRKADNLASLVQQAVQGLPELAESLPPILADAINDRRSPAYASRLGIETRLVETGDRTLRPVIEISNQGEELVTLISMRVVVLDGAGRPIDSWHDWAATPITADDSSWCGPLMPGGTRRLLASRRLHHPGDLDPAELRVEVELTDIRVWAERVPARNARL